MLREEIALVKSMIAEEVSKAIAKIPVPEPPRPVEIDIDGIVSLVLDKINAVPETVAETSPKKGKEK